MLSEDVWGYGGVTPCIINLCERSAAGSWAITPRGTVGGTCWGGLVEPNSWWGLVELTASLYPDGEEQSHCADRETNSGSPHGRQSRTLPEL